MEELFSEELLYACVEIKGCHNPSSPKSESESESESESRSKRAYFH